MLAFKWLNQAAAVSTLPGTQEASSFACAQTRLDAVGGAL